MKAGADITENQITPHTSSAIFPYINRFYMISHYLLFDIYVFLTKSPYFLPLLFFLLTISIRIKDVKMRKRCRDEVEFMLFLFSFACRYFYMNGETIFWNGKRIKIFLASINFTRSLELCHKLLEKGRKI